MTLFVFVFELLVVLIIFVGWTLLVIGIVLIGLTFTGLSLGVFIFVLSSS